MPVLSRDLHLGFRVSGFGISGECKQAAYDRHQHCQDKTLLSHD